MQRILLLLFFFIPLIMNAQPGKDYKDLWAKVKTAEDKGLTKTADDQVNAIYRLAEKENNHPQVIKASLYRIRYRNMIEEESEKTNFFFMDTLIGTSKAPARNILYSIQAEMLWQYLQQNRWRFYNRTALVEEKSTDISTWSIAKLHSTITALHWKALENATLLKQTKVDLYDAILEEGETVRYLRPTLYDLLAHRALEYFRNDERNIAKPAYAFKITQPEAFSPAAEFVKASFKTKDTSSQHHKALLVYQDLLSFHLNDAKPDALIDADIGRLSFVQQFSTLNEKDKLYENALKNIEEKYSSSPASAQAAYLRALLYSQRGNDYNPLGKTDNQYEIKRAKELAEATVKKFPNSEGGLNSKNLLINIGRPSLNMETEVVNVPAQPFRMLVSYKNIPKLYLRIIKTSHDELKNLDRRNNRNNNEDPWVRILAMKTVKQWSVTLPDPGDYQQHSVEIKIDALDKGTYMLVGSMNAEFSMKSNLLARDVFYISNIAYIKKEDQYHVLHRETGQPLKKASIQSYELRYNYNTYIEEEFKAERYTADDNGLFTLARKKESHNYIFDVRYGDDQLFMDGRHYNSIEYDEDGRPRKDYNQSFLFTDRSIYRPGQTVYFKGILVKTATEAAKTAVIPNAKVTIQLKDANWQKVSEMSFTTNEYGSYNGNFRLPEGLLTGQFSLWDSANNKQVYFSVEEYKRPKFFAEIKQPKGSYRVNDSIKVTGTAKAYAGNNIDGAMVKYRVVRKLQLPWWWYGYGFGRSIWPSGNEPMEITNGETVTDAKGEFTVTFKAIPDESVKKASQPIFNYEVIADITDLNGETRSGSITVPVSYQALQLNLTVADKLVVDSFKNIAINSTNINGAFEKATVQVSIYKLKSPNRFFRSRYWQQPDQFIMGRDEYYSNFPYDIYKNEHEPSTWEKGDRVTDVSYTTEENKKFTPPGSFTPGWYVIGLDTKDKYGEPVKAIKYIELTPPLGQLAANTAIDITRAKTTAEPGSQVTYHIGTSFKDVFIIHHQQFMQNKQNKMYEQLSNSVKTVTLPVTENDRGGMGASAYFVKYNRVFGDATQFYIPWSNKQLNITFETFRDKTLPGSKEEYKVKISGSKGEKLGAEMLAAMYDASLDQFRPHYWEGLTSLFPSLYYNAVWSEAGNFAAVNSQESSYFNYKYESVSKVYDRIIGSYSFLFGYDMALRGRVSGLNVEAAKPMPAAPPSGELNEVVVTGMGMQNKAKSPEKKAGDEAGNAPAPDPLQGGNENVQIRKNFNETAFFFPDLKTDADGNIVFSYTIPEALTEWKLMTVAHTKDMASGFETKKVITQKPLMVQPNAPRFLREGDRLELVAKVVNLTDKEVTGTAELQLIDPENGKPVDGWFKNVFPNQYFTVAAGQSTSVPFTMEIPFNYNKPVTYRIIAKSKDASDGEENMLPVVTNRMLVTETMPLPMRGSGTKNFKFDKLLNSNNSGTLTNHAVTVEYTSNPAWYAVQALPYLMEYPYECAEQTFNRFYANALAFKIANSSPRIKAIFDKWKTIDKAALLSNLQKNEELKSALLQETPWVMAAKNEEEQKKNIGLLFDIMKMTGEMEKSIRKLAETQTAGGAYTWFKGGPDDRYITQYIITGIGHLKKLGAIPAKYQSMLQDMTNRGISYLDKKIKEDYDNLVRYKVNLKTNNTGYTQIQYHYMRSFFSNDVPAASKTAYDYYYKQMQEYWLQNSKYMQGMIALATYRKNDSKTPAAILRSLKENAIVKEEMGMYWKDITNGYYWHQAPIETMSLLVEAFSEAGKDTKAVDDLKTWLLKNKQTTNWRTTKATADACYALLLEGSDFLAENPDVKIQLGSTTITPPANAEAGTGYFKQTIEGDKVKPEMGNISVTVSNTKAGQVTSWGGVYWQYFEDLDKITSAETPLKLVKKLFIERSSDKGPVLQAVAENAVLHVGDKLKVRIELRVDRDMEYVHMKDMRSSGTEPVNVLSQYKWQGGLGYYESTKDASTNFFFHWLPKGTYVFEYPVFVTHKGNFSNGITTIQCMYAPEFTSHSEGVRVRVE